jgi:DNA polymerase I-like protein with 3'-5' exonuclease and polymerase domains
LNPPRGGGIRDCIVARPGCTFIFCDYEANEMRVLSQVLLDMFGSSVLAKNYQDNTHFDPHSYMASRWMNISYEEGMSKKENKDKEFKKVRQLMKSCNFGFPGGMAPTTFVDFAKGYGVSISEQEALDLKKFFFGQFPEIAAYLDKVGTRVRHHKGQGYLPRAQRLSGDRRFCQLANFYFQGLAAEGGLTAFTLISEACYTKPESPLYGCRPVLFVHDEIIVEAPLSKAHFAALEVKRIMETSMQIFTPDVPSLAEPTLATKWWKDAFQKYDENGHLVPSDI